jgi:hypothetical protein
MSGGIAQLVAVGAQDAHLVGKPEVSFFRSTYKRHTNFAMTVERQVIQGNPSTNGTSTIRFDRKGDLLSYAYLTVLGTDGVTTDIIDGTAIQKVELLIGGQVIDTLEDLATSTIAQFGYDPTYRERGFLRPNIYPLRFSFFEYFQSALPLIALQYHDAEVRITWNAPSTNKRYEAWANYIYLDNDERKWFSSNSHDMLIVQAQKIPISVTPITEININHPVKYIGYSNSFVVSGNESSTKLKLQINGVDIGDEKNIDPHFIDATNFYHTFNTNGTAFLLPFCLITNKLQPTGTLNFSRVDSARLIVNQGNIDVPLYAFNYNILRIQNGMGGLMYAN